jgi:hypothetical protein
VAGYPRLRASRRTRVRVSRRTPAWLVKVRALYPTRRAQVAVSESGESALDETSRSVSATCPVSSHTVANWGLHDVNSLDTTLVVRGRRKITQPGGTRRNADEIPDFVSQP